MAARADRNDALAGLLAYPGAGWEEALRAGQTLLDEESAPAARDLADFRSRTADLSPGAREELFTRTFDLDPSCCLEVGWHAFGEHYERGAFLVWVREGLQRHGLAESSELPDHLTHLLRLVGRMEPRAAEDLVADRVLPALEKVRRTLEERDNPYACLLRAIQTVLVGRYASRPPRESAPARGFPAGDPYAATAKVQP
ncbi:MAG: nitrate reductase molybdenum cofactor assembly chaperone [Planctomycetota bacterium]